MTQGGVYDKFYFLSIALFDQLSFNLVDEKING